MVDQGELRQKAKEIISREDVRRLIGWKRGTYGFEAAPAVIKDPEEADELIFDPTCVQNPASFVTLEEKPPLPRGVEPDLRKVGVFAKGCDSRALIQQLVEQAYERDHIVVIGIPCRGVIDHRKAEKLFGDATPDLVGISGEKVAIEIAGEKKEVSREEVLMAKCLRCRYPNPLISDVLVGEEVEKFADDDFSDVDEFEKKSPAEKWEFWEKEFSKCIRCYSCRNVCPMCYCPECVVTRLNPQWTRRSVDLSENTSYHIERAWHLAGRCIECMECERVCPMDIPIMTLNRKLTRDVKELFDYEPGTDVEASPLLTSYNPQDPEEYIM